MNYRFLNKSARPTSSLPGVDDTSSTAKLLKAIENFYELERMYYKHTENFAGDLMPAWIVDDPCFHFCDRLTMYAEAATSYWVTNYRSARGDYHPNEITMVIIDGPIKDNKDNYYIFFTTDDVLDRQNVQIIQQLREICAKMVARIIES